MHFYGASLTHAHTCAYVSPLFFHDKESLFYETSQPGECGVGFDSHSCSLFRQLCTGELVTQRIEEELGRPATLVVTGGLAKYVIPLCRHPLTYDPELLMKGLALLYQMNAPQHHAGGGKKRNQNFRRARRPYPQRRERREDEAKAG